MILKTCYVYIFPIIILLLYFSWATLNYIRTRKLLLTYITSLGGESTWDEKYININHWLKEIAKEGKKENINLCKNVAFFVNSENKNNPFICREMSREYCGIDANILQLINIPTNNNNNSNNDIDNDDNNNQQTSYYMSNGMKLLPGETYCINKRPPSLIQKGDTSINNICDEIWGFWKFSPIEDRWICHSKVPGIYNAKLNIFDPCKREDPKGLFLIDGEVISSNDIKTRFTPEEFYSPDFQMRCSCKCNKKHGFIFNPDISRTSCFKDPCLNELPPFAAAPGYNHITGNCECGDFFKNMFNDISFPCTACPYNWPQYDEKTHTLTIYIKCYNEENRKIDVKNRYGIYPCQTEDDIIKGCTKAIVQLKPIIKTNKSNIIPLSFDDRIFFNK